MYKKLLYGIAAFSALFNSIGAEAQGKHKWLTADSALYKKTVNCGLNNAYILAHSVDTSIHTTTGAASPYAIIIPTSFPASAIDTCDRFQIFYEDKSLGTAEGFDDPSYGNNRRAILCEVLSYIQNTYDFSSVPSGQYIRLQVSRSYTAGYHAPSGTTFSSLGSPYFRTGTGVSNGFVAEFANTGTDPLVGHYHAQLQVNFDSMFITTYTGGTTMAIDYFQTPSSTAINNCEIDLNSSLLHSMTHCLGWYSFIASTVPPLGIGSGMFTSIDTAAAITPDATTSTAPFSSIAKIVSGGTITHSGVGDWWMNSLNPPYNHPISIDGSTTLSHLSDGFGSYAYYQRISPGDWQEYVMSPYTINGKMRRVYTKGELETIKRTIGYNYTSSYTTAHSATIGNHVSYSSKMFSDTFNRLYLITSFNASHERMQADYSMTNDSGATITIDLALDTTIHDADGNTVSVAAGTLVNLRGCGVGGNNHNSLVLSAGNTKITYTPRHNFYGKAQLAFNLYDGVEKGAYVVYTIDVKKGNNVSVPFGQNLILNGDFEEGTEVKTIGSGETIPNTVVDDNSLHEGRFSILHLGDSHPYDCFMQTSRLGGAVSVKNSYASCNDATTLKNGFGTLSSSFPFPLTYGGGTGGYYKFRMSGPSMLGERIGRSEPICDPSYYYLGKNLEKCHRYVIEFDLYRPYFYIDTLGYTGTRVNDSMSATIGFSNDRAINFAAFDYFDFPTWYTPTLFHKLTPLPKYVLDTFSWQHMRIPFDYCSDSSANILFFQPAFFHEALGGLAFDNLSIVEDTSTFMKVKIKDSITTACNVHRLLADTSNVIFYRCDTSGAPLTYTWLKGTDTIGSTPVIYVTSGTTPSTYKVIVSEGCRTAIDYFTDTVTSGICPCSPSSVFGTSAIILTTATLPTTIPSGYYYINNNITINNNTVMTGAKILIEPGVQITVSPSAKLTLDNCHLFTCPDTNKLWKGIELLPTANIEVLNNSLIEDAEIAINATNPVTPSVGKIIKTNQSVFNRNRIAISINNYSPSTPSVYPFEIGSTVFTSRDLSTTAGYPNSWVSSYSLRTIYPNTAKTAPYILCRDFSPKNLKNNIEPLAGLQLKSVGRLSGSTYAGIQIGTLTIPIDYNLFDNVGDGINALSSNFTVYSSNFANNNPVPLGSRITGLAYAQGTGIYATKGFQFNANISYTSVANYLYYNNFYDCGTGVKLNEYSKNNIYKNNFYTSNANPKAQIRGIDVASIRYESNIIDANKLYNTPVGIYFNSGTSIGGYSLGNTQIVNNLIQTELPSPVIPTGSEFVMQGIEAAASLYSKSGTIVSDVKINNNTLTKVYNAIKISNYSPQRTTANNNVISLKELPSAKEQFGIYGANNFGSQIIGNSISMPSLPSTDKISGVYSSFNTNTKICGNTTSNVPRAFNFAQTTAQTETRWIDNAMTNSNLGFVLGSDIGDQGAMWDYMGPYPLFFWGATLNKWTGFGGTKYETYVENKRKSSRNIIFVQNITSPPAERPTNNNTSNIIKIYPWLYEYAGTSKSIIVATPTLLANCDGGFYPSYFAPPSGGSNSNTSTSLASLIIADAMDYGIEGKPNQWMAQLSLYEAGLVESALRDSFATFDSFMTAAANSRYAWIANVETALGNGDTTTAENLLAQQPQAMGRVVIDSNIVITDYNEVNYIVAHYHNYYTAYLQYIKGKMTAIDSASVANLASLCPAINGAVVYKARTLHHWLSDSIVTYEDDSCMYNIGGNNYRIGQQQGLTGVGDETQSYSLFPNPNVGSFVIKQLVADDKKVQLKVYNAIGALVYQSNATFANGQTKINIGERVAGVYLVCLGDEKGRIVCLRFTIK